MTWAAEAGEEYYVQVTGDTPSDAGKYTIEVESSGDLLLGMLFGASVPTRLGRAAMCRA